MEAEPSNTPLGARLFPFRSCPGTSNMDMTLFRALHGAFVRLPNLQWERLVLKPKLSLRSATDGELRFFSAVAQLARGSENLYRGTNNRQGQPPPGGCGQCGPESMSLFSRKMAPCSADAQQLPEYTGHGHCVIMCNGGIAGSAARSIARSTWPWSKSIGSFNTRTLLSLRRNRIK